MSRSSRNMVWERPKSPTSLSRYSRPNPHFPGKPSTAMTFPESGIKVMGKGNFLRASRNFERSARYAHKEQGTPGSIRCHLGHLDQLQHELRVGLKKSCPRRKFELSSSRLPTSEFARLQQKMLDYSSSRSAKGRLRGSAGPATPPADGDLAALPGAVSWISVSAGGARLRLQIRRGLDRSSSRSASPYATNILR